MKPLTLCALAALSSFFGAAGAHLLPQARQQRELSLESLRLVDAEGRTRIVLGPLEDERFGLRLLSETGVVRASLEMPVEGEAPAERPVRIAVHDSVGLPAVAMATETGRHGEHTTLTLLHGGAPVFAVTGSSGVGVEGARLHLFSYGGSPVVSLSSGSFSEQPSLRLSTPGEFTVESLEGEPRYSIHLGPVGGGDEPRRLGVIVRSGDGLTQLLHGEESRPHLRLSHGDDVLFDSGSK